VTVHYVTEQVDEGNILLQRSVPIEQTDTDGRLRQKLALLSGAMAPEVVGMFDGFAKPTGTPQDHALATLAPKPNVDDGYLERCTDVETIQNKIRAFNPLPGTSYLVGDQRVAVDKFELSYVDGPDGIYPQNEMIKVVLNSRSIRLFKKI
jgi:methionyl-tRNA formyltransferase